MLLPQMGPWQAVNKYLFDKTLLMTMLADVSKNQDSTVQHTDSPALPLPQGALPRLLLVPSSPSRPATVLPGGPENHMSGLTLCYVNLS